MKGNTRYLITLFALLAVWMGVEAQTTLSTLEPEQEQSMSVRAQARFSPSQTKADYAPWVKIIYRQVDLSKDENLPLYYPEEPIDGETNLFRLVMSLLTNHDVVAYEYLDGRELFTEEYELNVKDMLDRFHILYEEKSIRGTRNKRYEIAESDIPTNEVLSYYLREKWVFNQQNSRFYPSIEAICPVLHRAGDFGGEPIRYPMFWITYDTLRPYLAKQFIPTSSDNNARNRSIDDYFSLRLFNGEIYKTGHLSNKSLVQLFPEDSLRTKEQERIEAQLAGFQEHLWVAPAKKEETISKDSKESKKEEEKEVEKVESKKSTSSSVSTKKSERSSSSSSSSSSSAAPIRSVRRTR